MLARSILAGLVWGTLAMTPTRGADLPAQVLPVYGGAGGSSFSRSCGTGRVVTGFRYRAGLSIDAIGLLCRTVNANGSLGTESAVGTMAGGGGGSFATKSCSAGYVLAGMHIAYGAVVDGVYMNCREWSASTRSMNMSRSQVDPFGRITYSSSTPSNCEAAAQPVVSIRGRAALLVDALGLTCNEP